MFSVTVPLSGCTNLDFELQSHFETVSFNVDPDKPLEPADIDIALIMQSGRYYNDNATIEGVYLTLPSFEGPIDEGHRLDIDFPIDFSTYFDGEQTRTVTLENRSVLNANLVEYCDQVIELTIYFELNASTSVGFTEQDIQVICD